MTVQTPQEPGHYPTAPPWASTVDTGPPPVPQTAAPLFGGTVPAYGSPDYKHGQLLVRFPGEVHAAGRPEAPSWRPVVVWTFFLSALGVISALRRAALARHYGRRREPYWTAFGATLLAGAAFWSILTFNVVIPLYQDRQEDKITAALQDTLLGDARITKSLGAVTSVSCQAEDDRNADGLRTYLCTFQRATGTSSGKYVEADGEGNWQERN
ncbi:hypothetical protein [Actinoplanes utahensis]|uniref:Uncharacterized protein n=1 Tax=Actinoplanes utahensis TaxID=1869 RepID=A0A0A6UM42_ACTUT|nr:hypothetical protein [Actinoplanes utahensis]KHD76506.1 hypothetical protein MB27_15920 [Actinoplanes utahensis]GIF31169.1 hypothetical protein Aut01nite_41550 [Actinoplanes utahensis]